jgi:hypothetical protein
MAPRADMGDNLPSNERGCHERGCTDDTGYGCRENYADERWSPLGFRVRSQVVHQGRLVAVLVTNPSDAG